MKKTYVIEYSMFEGEWISDFGHDTNWLWLAKIRKMIYEAQGFNARIRDAKSAAV